MPNFICLGRPSFPLLVISAWGSCPIGALPRRKDPVWSVHTSISDVVASSTYCTTSATHIVRCADLVDAAGLF